MPANRLLIIDDDPAVAKTIQTMAEGFGFQTEAVSDSLEFLDRVSAWRPTVIVMDLQMPGTDGIELLRGLSALQYAGKIVIASGMEGRIVEAARRLGDERGLSIAAALLKPFRVAEFRAALEPLLLPDQWDTPDALAAAIDRHQFVLAYQPKIEVSTGIVVGFEALARWQHPTYGMIPPDKFITLAEQTNLIDQLTDEVIRLAVADVAEWGSETAASLAVNLSARNLHDLAFADRLSVRCAEAGVPVDRLILEVTESSTMMDPVDAMDILTRLRLKGARLSIDDFGTGYSSLSQLVRLPFSELKIDKSFVMAATQSPDARAVVKSTIELAHSLGLHAVAEGVEDQGALELLAGLGCDHAQGYHIGKPLPAAAIRDWLIDWERRRAGLIGTVAVPDFARAAPRSPWDKHYDGSDEMRAAFVSLLVERLNPLWDLGRNSLVGWRPARGGIEVIMAPYHGIVDKFAESQRLLRGRRLMGDGTFRMAKALAGSQPAQLRLPLRVLDDEPGAVPTDVVEQVLRRYGITETQHRAVALFDIVGFSMIEPRYQVAQLNSLECSINAAHGVLHQFGKAIDLARTTTGDGFYIWNREKGVQADLNTYLLAMLALADNAIAKLGARPDMVPELRTCYSVGPHYSYYQVEGLDPRGHDYIVGDVTIELARMISQCLPGQILVGDFDRPVEDGLEPSRPLQFVVQADSALARFGGLRLQDRLVSGIRCYLTGVENERGGYDIQRYLIRDKHGLQHQVFNQKFNIYLSRDAGSGNVDALYLGKRQEDLGEFEAASAGTVPLDGAAGRASRKTQQSR